MELRFEPGASGCEVQTLPLCYVPPKYFAKKIYMQAHIL